MQFNRRVLEEAEDPANPLLERVKFLAITGSNLDEYVEIRQAGLMQRIEDGYREPGYDGLRPDESLAIPHRRNPQLRRRRSITAGTSSCSRSCANRASGCWSGTNSSDDARAFAQAYFQREVDPLLTPIAIDPAHPFPRVLNKALCLALLLRRKRKQFGPAGAGRGHRAPRSAALCAPARRTTAHSTTCFCRT